jgi:hypothetical protein
MPQRGSESVSAAARLYFLDEIRPLSVTVTGCRHSGQSGVFFGLALRSRSCVTYFTFAAPSQA